MRHAGSVQGQKWPRYINSNSNSRWRPCVYTCALVYFELTALLLLLPSFSGPQGLSAAGSLLVLPSLLVLSSLSPPSSSSVHLLLAHLERVEVPPVVEEVQVVAFCPILGGAHLHAALALDAEGHYD